MAKVTYIAFLELAEDGTVGVVFPDLDGCVSAGDTADEAVANAHEALSLHLEGMAEEGIPANPPTQLQALVSAIVKRHFEGQGPTTYAAITVEAPDAAERVNIYLAKSLLERIDVYCRDNSINRSGFFVEAAKDRLEASRQEGSPRARGDTLVFGANLGMDVRFENNHVTSGVYRDSAGRTLIITAGADPTLPTRATVAEEKMGLGSPPPIHRPTRHG